MQGEDVEIDLREVVGILRRQQRLILLTVALIVGAALVYVLTATPIYRATALVQIEVGSGNLLDASGQGAIQSATANARVDSEVEILRSEATALAVVEARQLFSDPEFGPRLGMLERIGTAVGLDLSRGGLRRAVGLGSAEDAGGEALIQSTLRRFQSATDIRRRGLTYLIAISVSSESPRRAAELANAMAEVYIERQLRTKTQSTIASRDILSRQLENARRDLAAAEDALNLFIEQNLARLEAETGDAAVARLRQRLEQAQAGQRESQVAIDEVQLALAAGDWETVSQRLGDAAVQELERQRRALETRLAGAATGSAEAIDLRAALANLESDLAQRSQAALGDLRSEVTRLSAMEGDIRDSLRENLLQGDLSSAMLSELFGLQQAAGVARNQYQTLLSRVQDFGALVNLQMADARVVSEALPPNNPSAPNRRLVLGAAAVAALGLGIGLAFLNEYYVGGVTSANQLRNVLGEHVPATIPLQDLRKERLAVADQIIEAPLSPYSETFRRLRSAVDLALRDIPPAEGGAGRVVLVSSALPAEGKSTAAIALARTYAAAGVPTLLIDADMRRPSLHSYLNVSSEVGLLNYLRGDEGTRDTPIQPIQDPLSPLTVITGGGRSNEPTDQLLSSQTFAALLQAARDRFAMILIDSPPVLPVVDARYLARYSDVLLLIVRQATSTQSEARTAAQQLHEMMRPEARLLGVLSHEQRHRKPGYYYRGRYYDYYGGDT